MSECVEIKDGESVMRVARADHEWLGVIDIASSAPVTVEIKGLVRFKAAMEGGREERGIALVFAKGAKKLILNAGNTTKLWEMFGDDVAKWKGKTVTLVVEKLPRAFNGKTHGIRIRPTTK